MDAFVPLAKLFTYANEVRSVSQSERQPTLKLPDYEPAPDDVGAVVGALTGEEKILTWML